LYVTHLLPNGQGASLLAYQISLLLPSFSITFTSLHQIVLHPFLAGFWSRISSNFLINFWISLKFFWGGLGMPEFWVLILSHTTITYTYFVLSMAAAIESVMPEMEEVASTLGAKPLTIFRRIHIAFNEVFLVCWNHNDVCQER
jgi:ABC-type glycerol-3-phosphate transport system permease component